MNYTYSTPQEAIISLERAYTYQDLEGIISSKDFVGEAKLLLRQASSDYDLNDKELISETAKLLELTLIKHLKDEGYPNFEDVERQFEDLQKIEEDLYVLKEILTYPDGEVFTNNFYLSIVDNMWKVVSAE